MQKILERQVGHLDHIVIGVNQTLAHGGDVIMYFEV